MSAARDGVVDEKAARAIGHDIGTHVQPHLAPRSETLPPQSLREEEAELQHENNFETSPAPSDLYLIESKHVMAFSDGDPGNPYNWSKMYKAWVVLIGILAVLNSTVGSAMPSGAIPELAEHFHIANQELLVLPNSIYLAGYVVGPLAFGPLSEKYGRQILMLTTFAGYTIFTLATCFSPNFAAFVMFRLITGVFASAPISVTGGLVYSNTSPHVTSSQTARVYADLYNDPVTRGRAMGTFMTATALGPSAAPIISGYLGPFGWRWPYWVLLMMTGSTWCFMIFHPETYGPTILQRRARKIRKISPGSTAVAPIELEPKGLRNVITVVLTRPVRMFFTEAIVLSCSLYLSLLYAIQYLFFQAYPIIYPDIYGFTEGEQGLAFIAIGVGCFFSALVYLWWDHYLRIAQLRGKSWASCEDYRRAPLACIGGPLITIGIFWIGWLARSDVPWIVPILGGLWFGTGYLVMFMGLLNYLIDAYEVFAASAIAAASCSRSAFGAAVPFAAAPMFNRLGVAWACSLLGFLTLAMCAIPFVFIAFGDKLRENSKFCQQLKERKRMMEEEEEATRVRRQKRSESVQRDVEREANKEMV